VKSLFRVCLLLVVIVVLVAWLTGDGSKISTISDDGSKTRRTSTMPGSQVILGEPGGQVALCPNEAAYERLNQLSLAKDYDGIGRMALMGQGSQGAVWACIHQLPEVRRNTAVAGSRKAPGAMLRPCNGRQFIWP
jgi:hypothetical protein